MLSHVSLLTIKFRKRESLSLRLLWYTQLRSQGGKAEGRLFRLMLRLSAKIHGSVQLSEALIGGELYQSQDQNRALVEGFV